ncbi:hypothetical protein HELRODRAFT_183893 [Helobdella robusta]|uniref:phosphoethanolamine N-methyltransferase n=1 Tax=Helobdella robusta TaxID=6412 RepID=T1FKA6_HELRO|nr:hypothetical protein HELRODRAFT_183893 [Helobdella robusta]ESO09748.1 hypothetical protein HELRODRAFT_183893 [Helobdella robusta]
MNCQVMEEKTLDLQNLKASTVGNFDYVLSCGLLSKTSNDEMLKILKQVLNLLKPSGKYAFCEDCSAVCEVENGEEIRRNVMFYNSAIESVSCSSIVEMPTEKDGPHQHHHAFEVTRSFQMKSSFKMFWLLTKTGPQEQHLLNSEHSGFKTLQEFLNKNQYTLNGILKYERIFGEGFISTGGIDTTTEFVEMLKLKAGEDVLDVGSGIGGGAFYMAQKFNVNVTGIDLSSNVVAIALERTRQKNINNVSFEVCDALKRNFQSESFDVIYSRDTILHISDKKKLFTLFHKWLRPGGRLLISDYCCTQDSWSDDFEAYVKQRGYILLSVERYGKLLEEVGFERVQAQDRTDQFVDILRKEIERVVASRDAFLKDFTESDYRALVDGWMSKLKRCDKGDQKWGLFFAIKN